MAKVYGAILSLVVFLIINNISCAFSEGNDAIDSYFVHSALPDIGSYTSIVKLREKRQIVTDDKNQYQSVTQNNGTASTQQQAANASVATLSNIDHSVIVPFNTSDRPLLGVNGTGQRKVDADKLPAVMVSTPIQTDTKDDATKKNVDNNKQFPKKVLGAIPSVVPEVSTETPDEKLIDNIDVPENETLDDLRNHNLIVNLTTDHHIYYNSTNYVYKLEADQIWNEVKNISHNNMLSESHRRAMTVELSFDFPFYGHPVRNVTVATGGFIYTGEYVHSWLAATQYVAPLMANFDTSLSNESFVRFQDNGTAFTVVWEKVALQDKKSVGKFTFSATLHKNGDIVFVYFNVPIVVNAIQDDKHPVKVGLSDAYIIDKVIYFARRKTIYEYHRVNFAGTDITNSTIIRLKALPTCLDYKDCAACVNHQTSFDCAWCTVLNRCSTGTDRKKQEWLHKGCERSQVTDLPSCPALGQKGNNAANQTSTDDATQSSNVNPINGNNQDNHKDIDDDLHHSSLHPSEPTDSPISTVDISPVSKESRAAIDEHAEPKSVGLALGFLVPICLVVLLVGWVLYAYRNPHTKSGQILIQYRPSTWSWRRGEARYTAATIHM